MSDTFFNTPDPAEQAERPDFDNTTPPPEEEHRERKHIFSRVALSILVLSFATIAAQVVLDTVLYIALGDPYYASWWRSWVLSLIPLYAVGLPSMVLFLRQVPVSPHNPDFTHRTRLPGGVSMSVTEEKPPLKVGGFLQLLIIALGCMYLGNIIGSTLMSVLSVIMDYSYANALSSMATESPVWVTILGSCVCAPIGEELLFRKLLIDRTRRYGDLASILVSGILFGLFHGNFFQLFYATLVGLVLAYLYTRTGRMAPCVALHAIINLLGMVIIPAIADLIPTEETATLTATAALASLFLAVWSYGMIIAAIALVCTKISQCKFSRGLQSATPTRVKDVILSPGVLVTLILLSVTVLASLIPVA